MLLFKKSLKMSKG